MKYEVKIKKLPKSEIEMEVSLPSDFLAPARKKALEIIGASMEIAGFRKGHIPENIVVEKAGESHILEEAADILLKEHFPKIIDQEKLDILGRPNISVTKLALNNPFEFKATFAVLPEFELPDYKAIASKTKPSKEEKFEATDKELEEVLLQIRKNKAHFDWHKNNPEHKEHDHPDLEKEENLPSLDDELAKSAGNFSSLDELKTKIKENIIEEKKSREIEKRRAQIMEELIKNVKIDLPAVLVRSESEKSIAQLKNDIARMKGNWEEYLAHTKKSEEDLRNDLKESSEKKAKIQLIFNKIAEKEKLEPNREVLENEVKEILKQYPDASEQNARVYVATILINQEVLKLLESQN